MDKIIYQHRDLAAGRWAELPFPEQMTNIGSEISRALKAQKRGNLERSKRAFFRALELFDFSITAANKNSARLYELCRAREEICDYFAGNNQFSTDPNLLQHYYDQFASLI